LSAIIRHSHLKAKRFSNLNAKKVFLIPPTGLLGLNQFTKIALMTNPAIVFVLAFSKQRPAVTTAWSGNITFNNYLTDGQAKGLRNSVKDKEPTYFPITLRTNMKF
jgi:hypothetical protein